jgi:hypothetical protein
MRNGDLSELLNPANPFLPYSGIPNTISDLIKTILPRMFYQFRDLGLPHF